MVIVVRRSAPLFVVVGHQEGIVALCPFTPGWHLIQAYAAGCLARSRRRTSRGCARTVGEAPTFRERGRPAQTP